MKEEVYETNLPEWARISIGGDRGKALAEKTP